MYVLSVLFRNWANKKLLSAVEVEFQKKFAAVICLPLLLLKTFHHSNFIHSIFIVIIFAHHHHRLHHYH